MQNFPTNLTSPQSAMDSFKNLYFQSSRSFSNSRSHHLFTIFVALILLITVFFFSASDRRSPAVVSYTSLASRRRSPPLSSSSPNALSPFSTAILQDSHLSSQSYTSCTVSAIPFSSPAITLSPSTVNLGRYVADDDDDHFNSCDVFDGRWVKDDRMEPMYKPGTCPFIDEAFDCPKNGRPDSDYLKLKWKPRACELPRFDGLKMLEILRGKHMVFVGDSLNRNMWESLVCAMREQLPDKTTVYEVSGSRQFKTQRFYSIKFKDFNCSIDFIKSPFLVQEWKFSDKDGTYRETLRLDTMESYHDKYTDADIMVFNTGHWWTHKKTYQGRYYFQEGTHVYSKLKVSEAYKKALQTWAQWVDSNINSSKTTVFFRGYSSSHFKGGRWDSGGSCDGETKPITRELQQLQYSWMMKALESVISKMKTPVHYLNITKMTGYRRDGHPSIYRGSGSTAGNNGSTQDCSHWCLPGVPDSWNELLYASLIKSHKDIYQL